MIQKSIGGVNLQTEVFQDMSTFPTEGVAGLLYIDDTTNKLYQWTGTAYEEVSESEESSKEILSFNSFFDLPLIGDPEVIYKTIDTGLIYDCVVTPEVIGIPDTFFYQETTLWGGGCLLFQDLGSFPAEGIEGIYYIATDTLIGYTWTLGSYQQTAPYSGGNLLFDNLASFPAEGSTDYLYIAQDTGLCYYVGVTPGIPGIPAYTTYRELSPDSGMQASMYDPLGKQTNVFDSENIKYDLAPGTTFVEIQTHPDFSGFTEDYYKQLTLNNGDLYSIYNPQLDTWQFVLALFYKDGNNFYPIENYPGITIIPNSQPQFIFEENQAAFAFRFDPDIIPFQLYYFGEGLREQSVKEKLDILSESGGSSAGESFYYETINKKFKGVSGLKLSDNDSSHTVSIGEYVYYRNDSDAGKIYKVKVDGTGNVKISDNGGYYLVTDGTYIYYNNSSNSGRIHRMDLDGTNDTELTTIQGGFLSTDGVNVYFCTNSDNYSLYKVPVMGGGATKMNSNGSYHTATDGVYVYYVNLDVFDRLFRINIDGTNPTQVSTSTTGINLIRLSGNIAYVRAGDGKLYKIEPDMSQESLFLDANVGEFIISGNDIYFIDNSNGGKIYKTTNMGYIPVLIADSNASASLSISSSYLSFINASIGNKLFCLDLLNQVGFSFNDSLFVKEGIENNNISIKIKTYNTLPIDTSYTFELANSSVEEIKITEGNIELFVFGNTIDYMGMDYVLEELFVVGDIITLYKTGEEDITGLEISSVDNDMGIQLVQDSGLMPELGRGIKMLVSNFQVIPNENLTGGVAINLETLFGLTTDYLYYRITLASTNNIKTPEVIAVEFTS